MNGKSGEMQEKIKNHLEEETNERKNFTHDHFNIDYQNTSKIYYQEGLHSQEVKINNYLCYQEGKNLYKITEILYEDKLIRIQDKFEVNEIPSKIKVSTTSQTLEKKQKNPTKSIEKVRIFTKDCNKNKQLEKKDKKNIVKNIVKIFLSWLEKRYCEKNEVKYDEAYESLKELMAKENFNNRLIKNIINNSDVCPIFNHFLSENADDQIRYSRIQDKDSHFEAIKLYLSLISSQNGSDNIMNSSDSYSMEQKFQSGQEDHNPQETNARSSSSNNQKNQTTTLTEDNKNFQSIQNF